MDKARSIGFLKRSESVLSAGGIEIKARIEAESILQVEYISPKGRQVAWVIADPSEWKKKEEFWKQRGVDIEKDEIFVLSDLGESAEIPAWPNVKESSIESLLHDILVSSDLHERYVKEVGSRTPGKTNILGITARVQGGGEGEELVEDLADYLARAVEVAPFIGLFGGFGRGKTTSLYILATTLIAKFSGRESRFFPIFVDTAGWAAQGLEEAIDAVLAEEFRLTGSNLVRRFKEMMGEERAPVFLLDALDEQEGLYTREVARLVNQLVSIAQGGVHLVCALRPEVLSGEEELDMLLRSRLTKSGISYRFCHLEKVNAEGVQTLVGENLEPQTERTLKELVERPLWLSYVANMSNRRDLAKVGLLEVIEECIGAWAGREEGRRRPVLVASQREGLTIVVAYCLYTGSGPAREGVSGIPRNALLDFLRSLLENLYGQRSGLREVTKWIDLSRDVAAESVAVANLLTSDSKGEWRFSEEVFFEYYLARAFLSAVAEDGWVLSAPRFLDELGVTRPRELLGVAPLPDEERFLILLEALTRRAEAHGKGVGRLLDVITATRPSRVAAVPEWEQLVVGEQALLDEEERTYEIAIPPFWPSYQSAFAASNAVRIMGLAAGGQAIEDMDLSYTDLTGGDLRGLTFRRCQLRGADLSYASTEGAKFIDCDLKDALFFKAGPVERDCLESQGGLVAEGDEELQEEGSRAAKRLAEFAMPGEEWLKPNGPVKCEEMKDFPMELKPVLMDLAPVTNEGFESFVSANPSYSRKTHSRAIENNYYLLYMGEAVRLKPVVYVSLVAATAFALWKGKRLPTFFELEAFCKKIGAGRPSAEGSGEERAAPVYEDVPDVVEGETYGFDWISEWTYQVDDERHWDALWRLNPKHLRRGAWRLPPYSRIRKARCEYLVWGDSFLRRDVTMKNSKPATWINPDQGFRCTMDYRAVTYRAHCKNGIATGDPDAR